MYRPFYCVGAHLLHFFFVFIKMSTSYRGQSMKFPKCSILLQFGISANIYPSSWHRRVYSRTPHIQLLGITNLKNCEFSPSDIISQFGIYLEIVCNAILPPLSAFVSIAYLIAQFVLYACFSTNINVIFFLKGVFSLL